MAFCLARAMVAEGATGQQLADHSWKPGGIGGVLERGVEWVEYITVGLLSGAPGEHPRFSPRRRAPGRC